MTNAMRTGPRAMCTGPACDVHRPRVRCAHAPRAMYAGSPTSFTGVRTLCTGSATSFTDTSTLCTAPGHLFTTSVDPIHIAREPVQIARGAYSHRTRACSDRTWSLFRSHVELAHIAREPVQIARGTCPHRTRLCSDRAWACSHRARPRKRQCCFGSAWHTMSMTTVAARIRI